MVHIIKNSQRDEHWEELFALLRKHFSNPDWVYDPKNFEATYKNDFFVMGLGLDDGKPASYLSMAISTREGFEGLQSGKLKEHDIVFYPKGGSEKGHLFLMTLILDNHVHAPWLLKSTFNELEIILRRWKINIDTVYAIAYTKVSERLMRKQGFDNVGVYEGHYPIMAMKAVNHPWLAAFIPHVGTHTQTPFNT